MSYLPNNYINNACSVHSFNPRVFIKFFMRGDILNVTVSDRLNLIVTHIVFTDELEKNILLHNDIILNKNLSVLLFIAGVGTLDEMFDTIKTNIEVAIASEEDINAEYRDKDGFLMLRRTANRKNFISVLIDGLVVKRHGKRIEEFFETIGKTLGYKADLSAWKNTTELISMAYNERDVVYHYLRDPVQKCIDAFNNEAGMKLVKDKDLKAILERLVFYIGYQGDDGNSDFEEGEIF